MSFYQIFKAMAFGLDAELAHEASLKLLSASPQMAVKLTGGRRDEFLSKRYHLTLPGFRTLHFPIGLAAGLDKNGMALDYFSRLWFGAIEIGTVTPLPQPGNPRPRLFRYPKEESLRNCMGFNNEGSEVMLKRILESKNRPSCLGINLGKNKDTPASDAFSDYVKLYERFHSIADYLVINISSPNTPGLRDLQAKQSLQELLAALREARQKAPCPLFVKLAPDMELADLDEIIQCCLDENLTGVIATNTTIMPERGAGGVSGKLLSVKAANIRKHILGQISSTPNFHCIGVGGISHFSDLWDFWSAGGRFAQIYTSFIFQGPQILNHFQSEIERHLKHYQLTSLEELLTHIKEFKRI